MENLQQNENQKMFYNRPGELAQLVALRLFDSEIIVQIPARAGHL